MSHKCDVLLTGGVVVTMDDDRRIIENGAVAVQGKRVAAVGPVDELRNWKAARVVCCEGQAVIPGLIDTHNHLFQAAARGLGDGMALQAWLDKLMLPLAGGIKTDEALAAVRAGALASLSCGTTTIIDNHYAPNDVQTSLQVAGVLHDMGLRGAIARGAFGPFTAIARENQQNPMLFHSSVAQELDNMRTCMNAWRSDRVTIWPSPVNLIYNDQDLVRGLVEMAREFGVPWHTHCSEAASDPENYQKAYGVRPFVWMQQQGLLGRDATFAHAIWLDDEEVDIAGSNACGIAHNPMSNAYLASGTMRLRDLRSAGAMIGMGTDGAAGHLMDMFHIMRQMVYVQRLHTLNPQASSAADAFELATRGGAAMVGIDAGCLMPGKLADIAVVSLQGAHMVPCFDPVASLVYCASGRDVTLTMVNGRIACEQGRAQFVDHDKIIGDARQYCEDLILRLNINVPGRFV
ncbi:MAG TPA: N-ethylammeline chlorohydrolase [Pusillimonas sp.]|jgi:5-methylthioadenosine/S-adenosylhomocysteine deaminase|nr:N-ethylammeline chlorohydrolase [Pusillimonas sp.]|tara:strand:+ start:233584 stop:234966 length:1383 start_codon:yes stop_codon:yes gene_type:complete